MAENVSAFDYKTQEEVLTVLRHLTSVLSVVGMALVETVSPTTLREPAYETPMASSGQVVVLWYIIYDMKRAKWIQ